MIPLINDDNDENKNAHVAIPFPQKSNDFLPPSKTKGSKLAI